MINFLGTIVGVLVRGGPMIKCGGSGQWWTNDQFLGTIVGVLVRGGPMINCGGSGQWWTNDQLWGFWAVVDQ